MILNNVKKADKGCKAVKILEFGKFLTVESGKEGKFGLWNLESWASESRIHFKESGFPLMIGIQNPSSTEKDWNPVPGIRNPRCGIQNPRLP